METLEVKCPECNTILIVNRKTGAVIETRKPLIDDSTGDRFEDARQRVLSQKDRVEKAFQSAKQREKEKFARLDAFFKEKKDEYKDQPIEKPDNPFDRD